MIPLIPPPKIQNPKLKTGSHFCDPISATVQVDINKSSVQGWRPEAKELRMIADCFDTYLMNDL